MNEEYKTAFNNARKHIKSITGLELSLIELVELKSCVHFCIELSHLKSSMDFCIEGTDIEAALFFLNKNYEIGVRNSSEEFPRYLQDRDELEKAIGFDYYPEFFKREQEERHLP